MDGALICAALLLGSIGLAADVELVTDGEPKARLGVRE